MPDPINSRIPRDQLGRVATKEEQAEDRQNFTLPKGYDSEQEFLQEMRTLFNEDWDYDRENREAAVEDAKFVTGDQWDERARQRRIRDRRPVLTINRLPAYIGQIVGNRRLNQTDIKVAPDIGGTKDVANIREGLIRNIEKVSRADRVYDNALQNSAIGGIGNFKIELDYADDDVFEQDIFIRPIPNPLSVVWDRHHDDPTGADAERAFEVYTLSRKDFNRAYPNAAPADLTLDSIFMTDLIQNGWVTIDDVRIVYYWRMVKEPATFALMLDGSVVDVTDVPFERYIDQVQLDQFGEPYIRDRHKTYAELYICTAVNILEGPYRLPIKRVPIFRVPGYEIDVSERRERFGVVRFAKDPQRLHNYWRSVIVEKLMLSPRARWMASKEAVVGLEQQWRRAHRTNDPLLVYNGDAATPPQYVQPVPIEQSLLTESDLAVQDMRDVTNMHEASLGQTSNEVSGRAIRARQAVGELGTVVYTDNLNNAIEEAGMVINDLIPITYDTPRHLKILGEDRKTTELVEVNQPGLHDVTLGKYAVTTVTGPSYATRRMEAQDNMLNMVNAMPQILGVAADLIIENQDWPGAAEIAARLRKQIPPNLIGEENLTEKELADLQAAQQAQAAEQQQQQQLFQLQLDRAEAEIEEIESRADLTQAQAVKALEDIEAKIQELKLKAKDLEIKEFSEGGKLVDNVMRFELDEFEREQNMFQTKVLGQPQPETQNA